MITVNYTAPETRHAPDAMIDMDLPRFVVAPVFGAVRAVDWARDLVARTFYTPALRRAVRVIEADTTARAASVEAYRAAVAEGLHDIL